MSDSARDRGAEGEREAMSFPIGRSLAYARHPHRGILISRRVRVSMSIDPWIVCVLVHFVPPIVWSSRPPIIYPCIGLSTSLYMHIVIY